MDFIDILIFTLISIILWYNYIKSLLFYRTGQLGNLTAPCNSHCKCSSSFYSAICGRDNIGYFSPCYAGCTLFKTLNDGKVIIFYYASPSGWSLWGGESKRDLYLLWPMGIILPP